MTDDLPPELPEDPVPPAPPPAVPMPPPVQPMAPPRRDDFAEALHWVFVGKAGIRAGWSLLIFFILAVIVAVFEIIVLAVLRFRPAQSVHTPIVMGTIELVQLGMVVVPTIVMALIERKRLLHYGFLDRHAVPRFFGGLAAGFLAATVLIGALFVGGWMSYDKVSLTGIGILGYAAEWGAVFLLVGLFEEASFRGYSQYTLTRGINFWGAAAIMSVLFGLVHMTNGGENVFGILHVMGAGLVLVLSLRLTGSLLWAVGFHASWDWAQSFFYGVPDSGLRVTGHFLTMSPIGNPVFSGGEAGPEGSVLSLVVLALVALGIWLHWRPKQPTERLP